MTVPCPRRIATTADALASACSLRFPSPRQKETAVSAPEPSEAEQAVIERFEAAPEPPEIVAEREARAIRECRRIAAAMRPGSAAVPVPPEGWEQRVEAAARAIYEADHADCKFTGCAFEVSDPDNFRRLAAAALTADAALAGQHTAGHRPLGGGLCVCGQPIHTTDEEADRG